MKKLIVFLFVLLLSTINLHAQDDNPDAVTESSEDLYYDSSDDLISDIEAEDPDASNDTQPGNNKNKQEKVKKPKDKDAPELGGTMSAMSSGGGSGSGDGMTGWAIDSIQVSPGGNSGAAVSSIPIVVPPGRKGIEPKLALNYNFNSRNGWIGVGWSLDMGAIQRSTKRGVDYDADDYVVTVNGSASELVPRNDWGPHYYGAKIEGAFSKYYKDPSGGWVVTAKDGTQYYYGSTAASRQDDPDDPGRVFK